MYVWNKNILSYYLSVKDLADLLHQGCVGVV